MPRPSKEAIADMTSTVMSDLSAVRAVVWSVAGDTEEMAGVETFVAIALRLMAVTNPSKLRDIMQVVEIQARMDRRHVYE